MSDSLDNALPDAIMKFEEDFDYVSAKLNIIRTKVLSIQPTGNENVNTPEDDIEGASNLSSLRGEKNESENKIADLCNIITKTANSDSCPTTITNLPNVMSNMNMASTNPVDVFSKFKENQCVTNSMDTEMVNKNFVNTSVLMNKAKKTAKETDLYIKKLNNNVLPRCWSAGITSDIINSRNIDVPSKITGESQYIFKKQLDKNIVKTNEKSVKTLKPNSKSQEKVHFEESAVKNEHNINKDPQGISYTPKLTKSIKDSINNVAIVNIDYEDKVSNEEENNHCKFKNLAVQKIPGVDLKPDLVTQKLANIRIKPDNKKTVCSVPNVAYSEFAFESEPQTCVCQPLNQPEVPKNKTVARNEIRKILSEMLENVPSNNLLNNESANQLQEILINLEESNPLTNNYSSQLENLVEQHSGANLNENIIKNKISEIAKNVFENENDGLSFDQVARDIERNSQQLARIKNSILAINPSIRFPKDDYQQDFNVVNNNDENHTIYHPNNNFNSRNFQGNNFKGTNRFFSIKEYLNLSSNNSVRSKIFENISVVKESDSKMTLCSKGSVIPNPSTSCIINAQNEYLNDINITHLPKKYQTKSKSEDLSQATAPEEKYENNDKKCQSLPSTNEYTKLGVEVLDEKTEDTSTSPMMLSKQSIEETESDGESYTCVMEWNNLDSSTEETEINNIQI